MDDIDTWNLDYSGNMKICENDSIKVNIWGLYTDYGKEILPPIYEYLNPISQNLFIAEVNQMKGVIDIKGNIIIPLSFDEIFNNSFFIVGSNKKEKLIYNYKGEVVCNNIVKYCITNFPGNEYIWIQDTIHKWYLIDSLGRFEVQEIEDITYGAGGLVIFEHLCVKIKGKEYFISPDGKFKISKAYDKLNHGWRRENLFFRRIKKKAGTFEYLAVDISGKKLFHLKNVYIDHLSIDNLSDNNFNGVNYIFVTKRNKKAIFNTLTRKYISPFRFKGISLYKEANLIYFKVKDLKGNSFTLDTLGKKIADINPKPDKTHFEIKNHQEYVSIIDTLGHFIDLKPFKKWSIYKDIIVVKTHADSVYILNQKGEKLWSNFHFVNYKEGDIYLIDSLGKKGIVKANGEIVFPFLYDDVQVKNGVFIAKKNKHWAILSKDKQAQTLFNYDKIIDIDSDHFALIKNKKWQLADKNGHLLSLQKYDSLFSNHDYIQDTNFTIVKNKNKYAVLNEKGELLTPFERKIYDKSGYVSLPFDFVSKNNKYNYNCP